MSIAYGHYPELHDLVERLRPEQTEELRRTLHLVCEDDQQARSHWLSCTGIGASTSSHLGAQGTDGHQVSRSENGRVGPRLEAVVRIADTLNVTLDHLLIPDASRRPLHAPENAVDAKLADLSHLTHDD